MTCLLAGCLQSGPPDYQDPTQTPPVLDLNSADPSVFRILNATSNENLSFNVPVRSEDRGVDLIAVLYVDIYSSQALVANSVTVPASTYSDTSRKIALSWTVNNVKPGCHRLTLLVTHDGNLPTLIPTQLQNPKDVAFAPWWLDVDDTTPGTTTMASCPTTTSSGSPATGGGSG